MTGDAAHRCPFCASLNTVKLVFGYPSEAGHAKAARGELAFGGCRCYGDARDPDRACRDCGEWFHTVKPSGSNGRPSSQEP